MIAFLLLPILINGATGGHLRNPPKQFTIRPPNLKLVTTLFHDNNNHRHSSINQHHVDPRKMMVDDVKELDGVVTNPNDKPKLNPRMQKMENTLLHIKTPKEIALAKLHKRVQTDRNEMSNRLNAWNKLHHVKTFSSSSSNKPDNRHANHQTPRFTRTTTEIKNTNTNAMENKMSSTSGAPASQYITTEESKTAKEVPGGMSETDKSAFLKSIETQVEDSEKLENAEVIEHTGEEDPDNIDNKGGGSKSSSAASVAEKALGLSDSSGMLAQLAGQSGDLTAAIDKLDLKKEEEKEKEKEKEKEENVDGPENGGGGEETPIYKYYKWWNLENWDDKALQSMVNSPSHGQLNTDVGGKASATNTHGDDSFAAQMADASSGVQAIEGEGAGEKKEDGADKCTDCVPFPKWTRKDNWIRTDGNFAPGGIVPPTEQDQKELEDAMKTQVPDKGELNDPTDPARTAQLQAGAGVGAGAMQNTLSNVMNQGVVA